MRPRVRAVALVLLAGAAPVGCSDDSPPPAATASPSPAATPTPTARPKPKPPPAVNPLTGLSGVPPKPVIAVKVDDTRRSRPQIGVGAADLVYVEQVEGGATRLVAVFASRQPATVGPVRSVRNNDPEILGNYGRPALAYSGGADGPVARLRRSRLIDRGAQVVGGPYRRLGTRPAPYNLVVNLPALARTLRGSSVSGPRDIGMRWARTDPRVAAMRRAATITVMVGNIPQRFRWDPRRRSYLVLEPDGTPRRDPAGQALRTANVLVPFSRARLDPSNVDVLGTPSVYTSTVGRGRLLLFRDGRAARGTWVRPTPTSRTSYLDGTGRRHLTLAPGGAWVLLPTTGASATYR
jgi:Protein of unknown function (DUF3048) N-terminal domain/Protein of unknown function (DUF3048) C-terminal domain